jgi:3',5'-nucleoside bisphosphate phosphatase
MANTIDLHTHSTASDGLYTPSELVQKAHEAGLRVQALTDHDSTDGIEEAQKAAQHWDIELIPGIELNTDTKEGEIHVLGYYLQYTQPTFQEALRVLRDARVRRGEKMVEQLNAHDIHIRWERVRELAHGSVGRPHVAEALQEAGYVNSVGEAFDKYLGTGQIGYVPRYKLSTREAVQLIRSANGLPVMAHPYNFPGPQRLPHWLPDLIDAGLVGLETYYGPYTEEQVQQLKHIADTYHLIPTGGTDYHGPNIHPTPLGGRYVPEASVEQLKAAARSVADQTPPPFTLSPSHD